MSEGSVLFFAEKVKKYVISQWVGLASSILIVIIYFASMFATFGYSAMEGFAFSMIGVTLLALGIGIYVIIAFVQMMNALRDAAENTGDAKLQEASQKLRSYFYMMIWSVVLSITIIGWIITVIIGIVKYFQFSESIKEWAVAHNIRGVDKIQIGFIVNFFLNGIGTIIMILGFKDLADGILSSGSGTNFAGGPAFTSSMGNEVSAPPSFNQVSYGGNYGAQTSFPQTTYSAPTTRTHHTGSTKACPSCGSMQPSDAKFCSNCGMTL